jgi:hypothetical protein
MGVGVKRHAPAALPPGKLTGYPIVQESGWAPGHFLTDAENLAFTGIRSPDRPARSELLYRLAIAAHIQNENLTFVLYIFTVHTGGDLPWATEA